MNEVFAYVCAILTSSSVHYSMAKNFMSIDAGSVESAYMVFNAGKIVKAVQVKHGLGAPFTIAGFGKVENSLIHQIIKELAQEGVIDTVVFEFPYPRGMPTSYDEFLMVEWVGRLRRTAELAGLKVCKVWRHREKSCVCGNGRATDSNIRTALIDIYGAPGTKKSPGNTFGITADVWQALAVAHTFNEEGDSEERKENLDAITPPKPKKKEQTDKTWVETAFKNVPVI